MPRAMVHPRLKRILSETETVSPTPTPDPQSDVGKLEPESEEQDAESEDKDIESAGELKPNAPAGSHSSMEISDGDAEDGKAGAPTLDDIRDPISSLWKRGNIHNVEAMDEDETPPASASQSTPRATHSSKSAIAPSPTSHATKETSPGPPSTSTSPNRTLKSKPKLKIKLKLGARPQALPEGAKASRRRKGKDKMDAALTFTLPARNPTEVSEASFHASAESEEADDADAESEDDLDASAAQPDDMQSMDVDSHVPADDVESGADADMPEDEIYESGARSGSRAKLTARQAVLASMVGAEHVELEAPTSSRKKNLTSEEIALRREETARKRKNMSEKKLEDEKTETINRLLKKQSSRSRAKRSALLSSVVPTPQSPHSGDDGESEAPAVTPSMPGPAWRWVSGRTGLRLGIPPEVASPPEAPPVRGTGPAVCDVAGCAAQRKYRLVRDFQRGACGMEHLRILNEGLAAG